MDFHRESLDAWDANAAYWDEGVGTNGNKYWDVLQRPTLERMVKVAADSHALDLATGNGIVARWLASRCGSVIATDGSAEMLKRAQRHDSNEQKSKITYQELDVTQPSDFAKLLEDPRASAGFDIIVMNMAIMDVASLEPLAQALPRLLKPNGAFVATMLHPVFFTSGATRSIEVLHTLQEGSRRKPEVVRAKVIRKYLDVPPYQGVALYGQPVPQIYFHRPMHELFSEFFKEGLVMDAMEEPAFTAEHAIEGREESHSNFTQIPPILSFRLRRAC